MRYQLVFSVNIAFIFANSTKIHTLTPNFVYKVREWENGVFFLVPKFIIAISFWHALTLYTLSYSVEKLLFDTKKNSSKND